MHTVFTFFFRNSTILVQWLINIMITNHNDDNDDDDD